MKHIFRYITLAAYITMMAGVTGCSHEKNELAHDHAHEHGHGGHDHDHESEHDHDHEDHDADHEHEHHGHEGHDHGTGQEIVLEPEQAAKMGVKTLHVHPDKFSDAVRVTGRITGTAAATGLVTAPTPGIFTFSGGISSGSQVKRGQVIGHIKASGVAGGDTNAAALANLNAAKREMDRLKPLYEKQLVTAEKYNAAVAAYEVAKAQYSPAAASGAVVAPVSGVITEIIAGQGQYVEPGAEIARISDGSKLTLTADLPDRYTSKLPSLSSARILLNNSSEPIDLSELGAHKINSSAAVSTTPGYIPVVFTFNNDGRVLPGSIVEVYLLGAERDGVITVPLSAITEQQGHYFVYIKVDDEGYLKSPVTLGARDGRSVEILSGVHPHDEVVVEGAMAVKLAETSGAVPEGHSHSH